MDESLRELYQEVILDHSRHPRHFGTLDHPTHKAEGFNPLCGDKATVFLRVDGDVVADAGFVGAGCSISTASASIMTESVKGKSRPEVEALFNRFHDLITQENGGAREGGPELGKLAVFSGVREFPSRVKCATLAWHALKAALAGGEQTVSTE